MAEQKAVDIEAINERGVIFNCNDLRCLSQNANEWINTLSQILQKYDGKKTKAKLHFWIEVAYAKSYIMRQSFCGGDFRERTYGIVDENGWFITYDYNNNSYRRSSVPDVIIYLAFMVQKEKINIEQAIQTMNYYALWRKFS